MSGAGPWKFMLALALFCSVAFFAYAAGVNARIELLSQDEINKVCNQ